MKFFKINAIAFLLLNIIFRSHSQTSFGLGPIARIGNSSAGFSRYAGQESIAVTSQSAGLFIYHMSSKHAGIQLELNYTTKGFGLIDTISKNAKGFPDAGGYKRKISYFEIPFLTHFEIGNGNLRLVVNAGPQISFALSSKETFGKPTDTLVFKKDKISIRDNKTFTFQYGLTGGAGLNYHFPFGIIQVDVRYHFGLSNMLNPGKFTNFQNQDYGVSLSYIYIFKKKVEPEKEIKETAEKH